MIIKNDHLDLIKLSEVWIKKKEEKVELKEKEEISNEQENTFDLGMDIEFEIEEQPKARFEIEYQSGEKQIIEIDFKPYVFQDSLGKTIEDKTQIEENLISYYRKNRINLKSAKYLA